MPFKNFSGSLVRFFLCLLIVTGSAHVSAAKIYQWVDEDGKKHFSQTPPPDNKQKKTVINTTARSSSILPEKKTDGTYCGKLRVAYNKELSSSRNSTKYLAGKVSRWETSLEQAEQRLNNFIQRTNETRVIRNGESTLRNSKSYLENKEKYSNTVNEYRCALNWATNQDNKDIKSLEEKYLKAKKDYAVALEQQEQICGEQPPDYNRYGTQRDTYLEWQKCQRKYNDAVKRTKNKLYQAEQDYRATK
jgi:hypothetical protein